MEVVSDGKSITFGGHSTLVKHYFDSTNHIWNTALSTDLSLSANTQWYSDAPADISENTMGGLHMLPGPSNFVPSVIPLSANHFVVVQGQRGDSELIKKFIRTIVATDPSVAKPVDRMEQFKIISAEKEAYAKQ